MEEAFKLPKHVVAVECLISDTQDRVLLKRHPERGWELQADDLIHFQQVLYRAYGEPVQEGEAFSIRREIILCP